MGWQSAKNFNPFPNIAFLSGGASIVMLGDSIVAQNEFIDADEHYYLNTGFFTMANQFMGQYFSLLNVGGVSGDTAAEVFARFETDVTAYNPDFCQVLAGTNDLLGSIPAATTITSLTAIYDRCDQLGIVVIASTLPNGSALPSQSAWADLNRWIQDECVRRKYLCADFAEALTDSNSITPPYMIPGTLTDNIHPNANGAYYMGKEDARVVQKLIRRLPFFPSTVEDNSNLVVNPLQSGTGGILDASFSGVCPDNCQVFKTVLPVGSTFVGSINSANFKRKFHIDITAAGVDMTTTFIRFASNTNIVVGKSYYAICEFAGSGTFSDQISLKLRFRIGAATDITLESNRQFADRTEVPDWQYDDDVLRTPTQIANAGVDGFILDLFLNARTCSVDIGRVAIIQVD